MSEPANVFRSTPAQGCRQPGQAPATSHAEPDGREARAPTKAELATPALLVDRGRLQRNIERMAAAMPPGLDLRPHVKTHKSAEIARAQIAAGAIGVTTATIWEALSMAQAGIEDILVANQIGDPAKFDALTTVAGSAALTIAVDNRGNAEQIASAAVAAGCVVGVLVEIDVGMGRCGVRSVDEAVALAEAVERMDGLRFRGVMGYEGHCVLEVDREVRATQAAQAHRRVAELVGALRSRGLRVETVSGGGTGTHAELGASGCFTELQAGSYVFMDTTYSQVVDGFESALTVLATVLGRHGNTVVLDAGEKTVAQNEAPRLRDHATDGWIMSEEHSQFEVLPDDPLQPGDKVEIVPGHCCSTVNLHDRYRVVDGERVIDTWPVVARGPGMVAIGRSAWTAPG